MRALLALSTFALFQLPAFSNEEAPVKHESAAPAKTVEKSKILKKHSSGLFEKNSGTEKKEEVEIKGDDEEALR